MSDALRTIHASAPGSIMITGEHAVVYGHKAIVAAIEQRIYIKLTERPDQRIKISSQIAPDYEADLKDLRKDKAYRFILAAIDIHLDQLRSGFELEIISEINPTLGLGSSAAVTIASLGALAEFAQKEKHDIHARALSIIQTIQGRGSGADLAASFHGGMIAYQSLPKPLINPLPAPPLLALQYSGYKTPTADVLKQVADRMRGHEEAFSNLYQEMGAEADTAISAAQEKDWPAFGLSLSRYQALMEKLGVSDDKLRQMICAAHKDKELLAAKISGSGLGDCVLALGAIPSGFTEARLADKGLIIDD